MSLLEQGIDTDVHRGHSHLQAKERALEETSPLTPDLVGLPVPEWWGNTFCCWRLHPVVRCHSSTQGLIYSGWLLLPPGAAPSYPWVSQAVACTDPKLLLLRRAAVSGFSLPWTQHLYQPCSQPAGSRLLPTSNSVARRSPVRFEETPRLSALVWGCGKRLPLGKECVCMCKYTCVCACMYVYGADA